MTLFFADPQPPLWSGRHHVRPLPHSILDILRGHSYRQGHHQNAYTGQWHFSRLGMLLCVFVFFSICSRAVSNGLPFWNVCVCVCKTVTVMPLCMYLCFICVKSLMKCKWDLLFVVILWPVLPWYNQNGWLGIKKAVVCIFGIRQLKYFTSSIWLLSLYDWQMY